MYEVVVKVQVRGGDSGSFSNDAKVVYRNVKTVQEVNMLQKRITDALFSLGAEQGKVNKSPD